MRIITLQDLRFCLCNILMQMPMQCEGNFKDTKLFCAHHGLDTDAVIRLLTAMDIQCDCEIMLPSFCDKYDKYDVIMGDNNDVIDGSFNLTCLLNIASIEYKEGDTRVTTTTNPVADVTLMEIKANVLENILTNESEREIQNYVG